MPPYLISLYIYPSHNCLRIEFEAEPISAAELRRRVKLWYIYVTRAGQAHNYPDAAPRAIARTIGAYYLLTRVSPLSVK